MVKIPIFAPLLNEKANAQMVKSVDTLVSGTSARKGVQVRVLFWALKEVNNGFLFYLLSIAIPSAPLPSRLKWKHDENISGLNITVTCLYYELSC